MQATVVALVVETSDGRLSVEHCEPPSGSPSDSLKSVIGNKDIQSRICRFALGREDFVRFECTKSDYEPADWHEALFIRMPALGFSRNSSPAFLCIVDRLLGRGPDEALTIKSARDLVTAVTSLFRRLEAHILRLEQFSSDTDHEIGVGVEPMPLAGGQETLLDTTRSIEVDSGLGIDDESVVEEWAPWMRIVPGCTASP